MTLTAFTYSQITDRLAEILATDERIGEGLRERPTVLLGPPRVRALNAPYAIFVYRSRAGEPAYASGVRGVDEVMYWELGLLVQRAGDPAELEQALSILLANIHRVLYDYRAHPPLWSVLRVLGSRAGNLRSEMEQTHELEIVDVEVRLYSVDM